MARAYRVRRRCFFGVGPPAWAEKGAWAKPAPGETRCATLTHMSASVGIRALQQNASAVVSRVEAGESIEITDRGRPVARLVPITIGSRLEALRMAGQVREASRPLGSIVRPPNRQPGKPSLSQMLDDMRADEH